MKSKNSEEDCNKICYSPGAPGTRSFGEFRSDNRVISINSTTETRSQDPTLIIYNRYICSKANSVFRESLINFEMNWITLSQMPRWRTNYFCPKIKQQRSFERICVDAYRSLNNLCGRVQKPEQFLAVWIIMANELWLVITRYVTWPIYKAIKYFKYINQSINATCNASLYATNTEINWWIIH
jgi:hypothetical protein